MTSDLSILRLASPCCSSTCDGFIHRDDCDDHDDNVYAHHDNVYAHHDDVFAHHDDDHDQ